MSSASLPPAVLMLQKELTRMPGIGKKGALRLAMHLLKSDREEVENLSRAILDVKDRVKICHICGFISDRDPCPICLDRKRENGILCVVEQAVDVIALEKGGIFNGKYHVLGGVLAPLDGVGPADLRIKELAERIKPEAIKELIVATNPTPEGEQTAFYLSKMLTPHGIKVSRIARGIPVGAELENADDLTLARALEGRVGLD